MTDARRARTATAAAFAAQGLAFSVLLTHLPQFTDVYRLSQGAVTLVVFAVVVLAGVGSVLTERLAAATSSRLALRVGLLGVAGTTALVALAPGGVVGFLAGFALYGIALGTVDAAGNMQGVAVQHAYGRSIIASFHAAWSAAAIAGALFVAWGEHVGVPLAPSVLAAAVAVLLVALVAGPRLLAGGGSPGSAGRHRRRRPADAATRRPDGRTGGPVAGAARPARWCCSVRRWRASGRSTPASRTGAPSTSTSSARPAAPRRSATRSTRRPACSPGCSATPPCGGSAPPAPSGPAPRSAPWARRSWCSRPGRRWRWWASGSSGSGCPCWPRCASRPPPTSPAAGPTRAGRGSADDAVNRVVARLNVFNYVGALVGAVLVGVVATVSDLRLGFVLPVLLAGALVGLAPAFDVRSPAGRSPGEVRKAAGR